jgi:glycosyltransferase involved in cell wall biosynthesis
LYIPNRKLSKLEFLTWLRQSLSQFKPDVIFAHTFYTSLFCRLALLGSRLVPLATVLHMDNELDHPKAKVLEKLLWRRSRMVVGVSPASLRNYQTHITGKQQTKLITNGLDVIKFRAALPQRDRVRREIYDAAPGEIILLQVGRISPEKRQLLTIQAFAELGKIIPLNKIRLVFVGSSSRAAYYEQIKSETVNLNLGDRVQFLGPRSDVPFLLAGADAHIMPSAWESQGIAGLEALASGLFNVFSPLECFEQFRTWPGVALLPENCTPADFANLLSTLISSQSFNKRYEHSMDNYQISVSEKSYLELVDQLKIK